MSVVAEKPSISNPNTGYAPLIANFVFLITTACAGLVRIYIRIFVIKSFGLDDIFILLAIVGYPLSSHGFAETSRYLLLYLASGYILQILKTTAADQFLCFQNKNKRVCLRIQRSRVSFL